MFKHALIPLDGTTKAESVFPMAKCLAGAFGMKITLFHILEEKPPQTAHGEKHLESYEEASEYLSRVARENFSYEIPVGCHVHKTTTKNVAGGIIEHIKELGPDIIIMCTHGGNNLGRRFFGSIAEAVFAGGKIHVLVAPVKGLKPTVPFAMRNILFALDGNPEHEKALESAASLARACSAVLNLVMVVPTASTLPSGQAYKKSMMPAATKIFLDISEDQMNEHLATVSDELREMGIKVVSGTRRGDPKKIIPRVASEVSCDLIILGSHGKRGFEAFWEGSLGTKILADSKIPVLLTPI